jgi:hypothetical protein
VIVQIARARPRDRGDIGERRRVREPLDREETVAERVEGSQRRAQIARVEIEERALGELVARPRRDGHVPRVRDVTVRLHVEDDARRRRRCRRRVGERGSLGPKDAGERAEPERLE